MSMFLFWVETPDHNEDWFVMASNEKSACQFHIDEEGYIEEWHYATARRLFEVPATLKVKRGWPSTDLLLELGAKFLSDMNSHQRIVSLNGDTFVEGDFQIIACKLADDALENSGIGRPNNTSRDI